MKKVSSILLVLLFVLSICSCKSDNGVQKTGFVEGTPSAVGDVFKMPKIESSKAGAPILSEITKQASPDDTV